MIRAVIYSVGVAAAVAAGLAAYAWARGHGVAAGIEQCTADYAPRIEQYERQQREQAQAVIAAQAATRAAEDRLAAQIEEQSHAYTTRIRALEAGAVGARRELQRLRDAVATARASARALAGGAPAAAGPAADGAAAGPFDALGECAAERVEVGGLAARLAEQVIGLQAYARLAQRACGHQAAP